MPERNYLLGQSSPFCHMVIVPYAPIPTAQDAFSPLTKSLAGVGLRLLVVAVEQVGNGYLFTDSLETEQLQAFPALGDELAAESVNGMYLPLRIGATSSRA